MAANNIIEQLLIIQEHDTRIRDMKKEIQDLPARKEHELARLDGHKKELAQSNEALKVKEVELKKVDLETVTLREKINKLRQQQLEIKTNKEFRAIEDEVKAVERDIAKVEDKELDLMEQLEQARQKVLDSKNACESEEAVIQVDIKALDERLLRVQEELKGLQIERDKSIEGVDKEWLENYQRIFVRKDKALVVVVDGVCSGCHMSLPPAVVHDARKRTNIVSCGQCGRMLY